jgi:hypothetical protein
VDQDPVSQVRGYGTIQKKGGISNKNHEQTFSTFLSNVVPLKPIAKGDHSEFSN